MTGLILAVGLLALWFNRLSWYASHYTSDRLAVAICLAVASLIRIAIFIGAAWAILEGLQFLSEGAFFS